MTNDWQEIGSMTDETWDREGEVSGILIEKKEHVGANDSKLYVLKADDKTIGVWGSTVLDTKFSMIPAGWEVKIKSLGTQKSKAGKDYHDYQVFKRPAPFSEVVGASETVTANDEPTQEELNEAL